MKRNLILATILFLTSALRAQVDTSSLDKYFDDGLKPLGDASWIAKLSVSESVTGNLSFCLERSFGKLFSLEFGVGVLLPYHLPDYYELISLVSNGGRYEFDDEFKTVKGGWSWRINPRVHVSSFSFFSDDSAPYGVYYSLLLRQRYFNIDYAHYNSSYESMLLTDMDIVIGEQIHLKKNFLLDVYIGSGVLLYSLKEASGAKLNSARFNVPLGIKLGYRF